MRPFRWPYSSSSHGGSKAAARAGQASPPAAQLAEAAAKAAEAEGDRTC